MTTPIESDLTVRYIFQTIEQIANKIGLTAQELWPYLVKQVYIQTISGAVLLGIMISVSLYVATKYGAYGDKWEKSKDGGKVCAVFPLIVIGLCIMVICLIVVPHLLNPEYYAFRNLMYMLKD